VKWALRPSNAKRLYMDGQYSYSGQWGTQSSPTTTTKRWQHAGGRCSWSRWIEEWFIAIYDCYTVANSSSLCSSTPKYHVYNSLAKRHLDGCQGNMCFWKCNVVFYY